jgi:hypothetical protein
VCDKSPHKKNARVMRGFLNTSNRTTPLLFTSWESSEYKPKECCNTKPITKRNHELSKECVWLSWVRSKKCWPQHYLNLHSDHHAIKGECATSIWWILRRQSTGYILNSTQRARSIDTALPPPRQRLATPYLASSRCI